MTEPLSLEQLRSAPLGLACPFSLDVPGPQPLVCEEVFRHLPGRRLAFRSHWGGADVLVKLFFRHKDFERERSGLQSMQDAGVLCPQEVWSLKSGTGKRGVLLATAFLDNAISLRQLYASQPLETMPVLLEKAVAMIGRLHRAGVMQGDIHLDNFLFREGELYMIDGGGIQRLKKPLHNLAMFFAQMVPEYDQLMPGAIYAYGAGAPEPGQFQLLISKMREKRIRHYLAKTTRNCSQFLIPKTSGAFVAVTRAFASDKLLRLMAEPEVALGQAVFLKQGNSATVVKVKGDDGDWVLKRYNIKDFWHALSRCWRPSRAWISWKSAHRLELLGIATPRPLGLRENRVGPLRREAYLLTEHVEGDNLQSWLLCNDGEGIPSWLDREVCGLFERMWQGSISHGDLKATNLIVCGEALFLIDLDALTHHRSKRRFLKQYRRDLQRFMDNWQGNTWQYFARLLQPFAGRAGITFVNKKV